MRTAPDRLVTALAVRYRILRELGEGGMATVYLAEDLKHTRQVAIKVLKAELGAVLGADRFVNEIRTTANLQHPNLLPLFDSGEADGFPTVTFEGQAFGRGAGVFPYDAAFTGGTLNGRVVIPGRVFTQLAARKAAWPVPYTADDLRATWLGSDRLLLFVQIAEPDEALEVSLSIDGKPVELVRAYNSIYGHAPKRTFLGFYADVSSLAPDVGHRIALRVPKLPPGRFQGLFFENVEPELTTAVR